MQRAELATNYKQCKEATAPRDFGVGFIPHRIFGWNSPPLGGRGTSALRFKFEQGLLCLQRAELATDCKQCKEATAPRDFGVGFIPHRIFGWNSPPLGGEEHLHLDYRTLHGFFQVY